MVIQLPRFKGQVAVVTGASSGIGAAIALHLVEAGLKVVGLARRSERVDELAKKVTGKEGKLYSCKADVSKEDDIVKAFKWVKDNVSPVSVLVNNAGVTRPTFLIDGDAEEWRKVIDTNLIGLAICTREAIKHMKETKTDGHIVNINSIAGHYTLPMPGMNMYGPSKYAVTSYTENLRHELNHINSKIKVTSLSPGVVKTEIISANNMEKNMPPEYHDKEKWSKTPILNSEDVADAVLYVLSTPAHVMINELTIRAVGERF